MLFVVACAMLQHGGFVQGANGADAAGATRVLTPGASLATAGAVAGVAHAEVNKSPAGPGAQGDVAELTRLIHSASLNELRTTYNGGYGASLFFYAQDLTFYVALFQDKHFWRVIKVQDEARAEEIYASFAKQTEQLADIDIRRAKLQAQTAYIERMIGLSEDRAQRLQADLNVARDQQAKVAEYQRQARDEALVLRDEKEKAQSQLRQLQQQVQQLQQQSEAGLPAAR
ncbi:DUF2968 domain-containing protein [Paraburkholderia rhizosphaerae]|nr:DUF2968 domain-containing protein [Paraburkholderia rhizosphaerae]